MCLSVSLLLPLAQITFYRVFLFKDTNLVSLLVEELLNVPFYFKENDLLMLFISKFTENAI